MFPSFPLLFSKEGLIASSKGEERKKRNLRVSGIELEGAGRSLRFRAGVTSREAAGSSVLRSDGLLQKGMAEP